MNTTWRQCTIGDVCDTISNTYNSNAQQVVLINTSDVLEGKVLNHIYIPNENLKGQFKKTFEEGDILYSEIRPQNKRYAYIDFAPINYIASTKLMVIRNKNIVKSKYLYYFLQSDKIISELQMLAETRSGTFPQITFNELSKLSIKIPPLPEQDRIISILDSICKKIDINQQINDNLEEQAKALFKSWFVDFDRNEWVHCELGDITLITAGGDRPSKYTNKKTIECHVPIYSNGIDNEGLYGYTNVAKIHEESITISARGTIGYVCLRLEPYVPIVRLISIIPNKKELSAKYLYLWALTQNITGTGTTQQQLTVPIFRKTPISIPSDTKLKQFNSIADPLFSQIESNKKENIKLSALRDTLLPKLMSGELSVEEVSFD
jgi:type I restriction enzyme S subunit